MRKKITIKSIDSPHSPPPTVISKSAKSRSSSFNSFAWIERILPSILSFNHPQATHALSLWVANFDKFHCCHFHFRFFFGRRRCRSCSRLLSKLAFHAVSVHEKTFVDSGIKIRFPFMVMPHFLWFAFFCALWTLFECDSNFFFTLFT